MDRKDEVIINIVEEAAKIILLLSAYSNKNGLYDGKLGAAIFLFHYDGIVKNDYYFDLANVFIKDSTNISSYNVNFSSGLSGVGWGFDYLNRKKFISIPKDAQILNQIDLHILKSFHAVSRDFDSIGISTYLSRRLQGFKKGKYQIPELTVLLIQEKLLRMLEEIHNDSRSYVSNSFILKVKESISYENWDFLYSIIDSLNGMILILKLSTNIKLYSTIVPKIINNYLSIFEFFTTFFINEIEHFSDDGIQLLYFLKSYNGYVNLFKIVKTKKRNHMQESFIKKVVEITYSKTTKVSTTYLPKIVVTLSCINSKEHDATYDELVKFYSFQLVKKYSTNKQLIQDYLIENREVNIGLDGIAGLGLALLMAFDSKIKGWEESILAL